MGKISQEEVSQVSGGYVDGTPPIAVITGPLPAPAPQPVGTPPIWIEPPIGGHL
jgi:hypothetical protein